MNKKQKRLEGVLNFFAWCSGMLVSLIVAYGVWSGAIPLPEFLGGNVVADIIGWVIGVTTIFTIILSFFRK